MNRGLVEQWEALAEAQKLTADLTKSRTNGGSGQMAQMGLQQAQKLRRQ